MKKEIKYHNRFLNIVLSVLIIGVSLILSGFFFDNTTVELDTETDRVYRNETADIIIKAFEDDQNSAKNKYANKCYLLYADVLSKKDDNREFVIGKENGKKKISCKTSDQTVIDEISKIKEGDSVRVYGKLTVDWFGEIILTADKVEKSTISKASDSIYSMKDGKSLDKNKALMRRLGDSGIIFYIPEKWKSVEHDITGEELGTMPGYQYRLNELEKREAYAESFFIGYFDKKTMLADVDDINENDLIEKAIIKDILKKDDISLKKFPAKKVKTYYGADYKYYKDTFTKNPTNDNYKLEMIFQEKGDGIIVCIYVYEEHRRSKNDIMMVLSMLS